MSSSSMAVSASARLAVRAGLPNVEIVVSDGLFREVARGVGNVELVGIPAGLYEIEACAGSVTETRLVSLKPGDSVTETVIGQLAVHTLAPVYEGATGHEHHHMAATRGTLAVRDSTGPNSGLVVLVRTLRDRPAHPLRAEDLSLVDAELTSVASFATGWENNEAEQFALWAGRLEPGGYALRTGGDPPVDRSLWLCDGWITVVFCSTGPYGPRTEDATVHMLEMFDTWDRVDGPMVSALEVALSGLRQGLPLASDELMRMLLQAKFIDPMLGIVGAHALRMRESYDRDLLATVVGNLRRIVPDHPDVLALAWAVQDGERPRDISWPPMLTASYLDLLLPAERGDPRVLVAGSVAERVAAYLTGSGPWLSWRVSDDIVATVAQPIELELAPNLAFPLIRPVANFGDPPSLTLLGATHDALGDAVASDATSPDHNPSDDTASDYTASDHTASDHTASDHAASDHTASDHAASAAASDDTASDDATTSTVTGAALSDVLAALGAAASAFTVTDAAPATSAAVARLETFLADAGRALQQPVNEIVDRLGAAELARRTFLPVTTVSAALRTLNLTA